MVEEASEVRLGVQLSQQPMEQFFGIVNVSGQLLDADVDDRLAVGVVAVGAHLLQLFQRFLGPVEHAAHHQRQTPASALNNSPISSSIRDRSVRRLSRHCHSIRPNSTRSGSQVELQLTYFQPGWLNIDSKNWTTALHNWVGSPSWKSSDSTVIHSLSTVQLSIQHVNRILNHQILRISFELAAPTVTRRPPPKCPSPTI